jgi:hypothetical protein
MPPRAKFSGKEWKMSEPIYFQWQNEILCKSIYPMRETKLRDFLVYYQEVDLWKEYKDKSDLDEDIKEYTGAQRLAAIAAYKMYKSTSDYFMRPDVRAEYREYKPIDEAELTEINNLHNIFVSSWPKDIRGEKSFVQMQTQRWVNHRNLIRDRIKSRQRRQAAMDPNHPKYAPEKEELGGWENVTLPMAQNELDKLRAFLATYDKVEKRKLDWYWMQKRGQAPEGMTEAEFLVQYRPENPPTARDIAIWKAQVYEESLEDKNQYQLLEEIRQRFEEDPGRYPYWLQYMVVHFSGMRYASAHGSWADPKELLVRLRTPKVEEEIKALDDEAVAKCCQEKIAAYESMDGGASRPKLADTQEKEWRDQIGWYIPNVKANGPKTRRQGLLELSKVEAAYNVKSLSTQEALDILLSMKDQFPGWAWKQIVAITPLRLTEVTAPDWEKLTPQEEKESYSQENYPMRAIIDGWKNHDPSAWREEHGRTHELIVTRAVCNETAEHVQHMRGHLPPGGLTPKPKWYLENESKQKISGTPAPYYVKATSAEQYTQGASVLWLRFVNKKPDAWQIAKPVTTKDKIGLLPKEIARKRKAEGKKDASWVYKTGEAITRERTIINEDKTRTKEQQWLRWIHEATVAEVAEAAEGTVIITYETALPDDDKGTSAVGTFKMPIDFFFSDGEEDTYNRSFVGYVPEGELPMEHIKEMLDWKKILRK